MKASEYGLPQLRPRVFIVGFKNDVLKTFMFPDRIPLQLTMSDIFNGHCLRKVGFTLRVGGRGSTINDRRNWEFYHVDNTIQRVTSKEAKKMQGFPDNFYFPVSEVKAMKQLGNSVAINVVYSVAKEVVTYLKNLENYKEVLMKNKGEWSELFVFVKLLHDKCIHLADKKLQKQNDKLEILKLTTENCNLDFVIDNKNSFVKIINKKEGSESILDISSIYNESTLSSIFNSIANASGSSFNIPEFNTIRHKLGLSFIKSGNSLQKSDILISFKYNNIEKYNDGFGIKSYIGSTATLLNASSNTNFLFHIEGLDKNKVEEINAINSKEKIKDRISKIYEYGGHLIFDKAEKDTMQYNLKMIDIYMPEIIGECLLFHYKHRISNLKEIVSSIFTKQTFINSYKIDDQTMINAKIKQLLVGILLGMFAGKKWDGTLQSNGTIVIKKDGEIVGFHIIKLDILKDFLLDHIKLDTPSSTRHLFGKIIDINGKLFFKLNLQLRFI